MSHLLCRTSLIYSNLLRKSSSSFIRQCHSQQYIVVEEKSYIPDEFTNVPDKILSRLGCNLHGKAEHPLGLIRRQVQQYFYSKYTNRVGNPIFSVYDNLSPVVSIEDNFDSLLVPPDHVSRKPRDSYYINSTHILRSHTTAHDAKLIGAGLDNFLIFGDVYRRDEIDSTHFPVFHQADGVKLFTKDELFRNSVTGELADDLHLFEPKSLRTERSNVKQPDHTSDTATLLELHLKTCLLDLTQVIFGSSIKTRWVETYFPFTHPSWELEMWHNDKWLEVLGCGILEQNILNNVGAWDRVGWAFGLGLERLAMTLYKIPDIRLFWSQDSGFLSQFSGTEHNPSAKIVYKSISQCPQCINDMSFWIPDDYSSNDFFDLVRTVGDDMVEQVKLIDEFTNNKSGRASHCYRIIYRHMERSLTQDEVNQIHNKIAEAATEQLNVRMR